MNPFLKLLSKSPLFTGIDKTEDELLSREDTLHSTAESPVRFEIIREGKKRGKGGPPKRLITIMLPILFGIRKTLLSLKDNPTFPKKQANPELFSEIETQALAWGASSIGYTKVPARWVFQNKAILYENAIVLSMEMDKAGIDTAPSIACQKTVMETYRDLGRITNKIARLLRKNGYGAHAGHPLMGQALYPPLAQLAGLGWMGLNGIVITPEHGPRVRLAAVYTSIENLPVCEQNEHSWVAEFCQHCHLCIKDCPPKAFYDEPLDHGNGHITYIDNDLCFPYFFNYYGCSVCIKVCPFNQVSYEELRNTFIKSKPVGVSQIIDSKRL